MASYTIRSGPVTIEAPVETVWRVLTDFDRYGEWNPFTPQVKAELTMGGSVDMRVTMGAFRLKQTEIICALEPRRDSLGARPSAHAGSCTPCANSVSRCSTTRLAAIPPATSSWAC